MGKVFIFFRSQPVDWLAIIIVSQCFPPGELFALRVVSFHVVTCQISLMTVASIVSESMARVCQRMLHVESRDSISEIRTVNLLSASEWWNHYVLVRSFDSGVSERLKRVSGLIVNLFLHGHMRSVCWLYNHIRRITEMSRVLDQVFCLEESILGHLFHIPVVIMVLLFFPSVKHTYTVSLSLGSLLLRFIKLSSFNTFIHV